MSDKTVGIFKKFEVSRCDGKHPDAFYFVLDLDHDPIARVAALVYAREASKAGYWELWQDITERLRVTEKAHHEYITRKQEKQ